MPPRRRWPLLAALAALAAVCAGCALLGVIIVALRDDSPGLPVIGEPQCSYTYGGRGNPALADQVRSALVAQGLAPTEVQVGEIGEDKRCSDGSSTLLVQYRSYSATLPAADLADRQALAAPLARAMGMLRGFATGSSDRVSLTFATTTGQLVCTGPGGAASATPATSRP